MSEAISLKEVAPSLVVSDVEASIAYFQEKLGFDVLFKFGEPTEYGAMIREKVQIHVSKDYAGGRIGKGSCYVAVTGVDALYEEITGRGATIAEGLETRPYQMRGFFVSDPDCNIVGFGQPAS